MRFLLLCKRYYTNHDLLEDRFGRLFHLPVQLARQGHKGLVIAADYRNPVPHAVSVSGLEFRSLPIDIRRLRGFVRQLDSAAEALDPTVVLASGDSYLGFLGLRTARRTGAAFVFDVYDDYSAFSSARIPGMRSVLRHALRRADLVVTASRSLAARYASLNVAQVTIENGVDPTLFHPMPLAQARAALDLPQKVPVVGFFGSMERGRGIETLLAAVDLLRKRLPALRLLLAGHDGCGLDLGRPGIDYRGELPQDQVPTLINACDVVTIPYPADDMWSFCNPCKVAEYLACGVPVVATRISDHERIFAGAPHGLCAPDDPVGMADAIFEQLTRPSRVAFDDTLSWEHLGGRLEQALDATLAGRRATSPVGTAVQR